MVPTIRKEWNMKKISMQRLTWLTQNAKSIDDILAEVSGALVEDATTTEHLPIIEEMKQLLGCDIKVPVTQPTGVGMGVLAGGYKSEHGECKTVAENLSRDAGYQLVTSYEDFRSKFGINQLYDWNVRQLFILGTFGKVNSVVFNGSPNIYFCEGTGYPWFLLNVQTNKLSYVPDETISKLLVPDSNSNVSSYWITLSPITSGTTFTYTYNNSPIR